MFPFVSRTERRSDVIRSDEGFFCTLGIKHLEGIRRPHGWNGDILVELLGERAIWDGGIAWLTAEANISN